MAKMGANWDFSQVLLDGPRHFVGVVATTGEDFNAAPEIFADISEVSKIDEVTQLAATVFAIEEVWYDIQGYTAVNIRFDDNDPDTIPITLSGNGYLDFRDIGGIKDPKNTGFTGDIKIQTVPATPAATATLHLKMKLKKKAA